MAPVKATLEVVEGDNKGLKVTVHFNPQSLRVNHRTSGNQGTGTRGQQVEKQGAEAQDTGYNTSLSIELLFDTSERGEDVRNTTLDIVKMIRPVEKKKSDKDQNSSPVVQFSWGTFLFSGNIRSMDETLDLFSEQGVPLRATVSLSMNGVSLQRDIVDNSGGSGGLGFSASVGFSAGAGVGFSASASLNAGIAVGTTPLTLAQAGDTLQGLAGRAGADWKAIANANNIDNPRLIQPGTVLNLNAGFKAGS